MQPQLFPLMTPDTEGDREGRRPSIGISPHSVEPTSVLSAEEIELLQRRFAQFNPNTNKTRALSSSHAIKLFKDDFPSLSEWEIQELFEKCDLNRDGHLALQEYLQTRAYYRLVVESERDLDIVRSFSILDTDSDGILVADDVLVLVEQAKQPGARVLKHVLAQAADATRDALHHRSHREGADTRQSDRSGMSKGEITLEHFANTIRDINRALEREIAAKCLRLMALDDKLESLQRTQQDPTLSVLHRANLQSKVQSTKVEVDVLKTEVSRCKQEVLSNAGSSGALGSICETLIATYDNEQHVYECLSNLITYCGLKDPVVFRYNLEQSGREVHVLDSILMAPPQQVKRSIEYADMMELSLHQLNSDRASPQNATADVGNIHDHRAAEDHTHNRRYDRLKLNSTLRRQFVFYTMLGDVTNLESMTRTSFRKFVRDCELHLLMRPPLTDPDIESIYSRASSCNPSKTTSPRASANSKEPSFANARMSFTSWLVACDLIFMHASSADSRGPVDADELEVLMKMHVAAKAKCIQTQNIAPDISLGHVVKLLRENLWQLRQIFFHFTAQSLLEVSSKVTLDMRQFLQFARAFKILRASDERDGEPYSPPPLTESTVIQPIGLMELTREYFAAKLDISFSNPSRREKLDLNFREFTRCIQRIALAMHAKAPEGLKRRHVAPNGIISTSFEAVKDDDARKPNRVEAPLYNRRGNILGSSGSPTKSCKMTSTSIISKLLHTSRALASGNIPLYESSGGPEFSTLSPARKPLLRARSPTKILYGSSVTASAVPYVPPTSPKEVNRPSTTPELAPRVNLREMARPWVTPYRPVTVPIVSPRTPVPPRTPRHNRPITCGGPAVVRVITAPPES